MFNSKIFKAYDIRGLYPEDINEAVAYRIGLAYAEFLRPKTVVVGCDVRSANESLKKELTRALVESGVAVIDIGQIATEMLYFAVGHYGYDGGIVASASHNPAGYGGMKLVMKESQPIFEKNGLKIIRDRVMSDDLVSPGLAGKATSRDILADYFDFIMSFIKAENLKPLTIVANPNFGPSGKLLERLVQEKHLPLTIIPLNFEIDGSFPKGQPDPLLPGNRAEILALAKEKQTDFGVAWDGDGDRVFFCDNQGNFYEPCYLTAVMIENLVKKNPGAKVLYDPRYIWAAKAAAKKSGAVALAERVGHSFIKERMRREDALFCGESSGHYYFKDNYYCDNGLIPFLLLWEALSGSGQTLPELLRPYTSKFFVSGEFNTAVISVAEKMAAAEEKYSDGQIDHLDGVSIEYPDWRFNLRPSNTEPLLRCNIEGKTPEIVAEKKKEIEELLSS
ncbi:MAG: phosphomannomutase/phosphoglucomutase [Patescibacteria group bacterium]|jgi:phosphomannomutase